MSLPDPIDLADMTDCDHATLGDVIGRRVDDDRLPRHRTAVKWPKGTDQSAYRILTAVDAVDQLGYRILASPAAVALSRRMPSSVVAHCVEMRHGTWCSKFGRWRVRREVLLDRLQQQPSLWLAKLDVEDYFSSLPDDVLRRNLNSVGLESWQVEPVLELRARFEELPGNVTGLPAGPEGSAVLGTIGLHSVDRLLASLTHFRLVDDVWLVADTEVEANAWADAFAAHLDLLGMRENRSKRQILTGADARRAVTDAHVDYVAAGGRQVSAEDAIELLESAIEETNLSRLRFALTALRKDRTGLAAPTILKHIELLDMAPEVVGRYLYSIASSLPTDALEMMVDYACGGNEEAELAGRIHVAHALRSAELAGTHRSRLMEAATCTRESTSSPAPALPRVGCVSHSRGRMPAEAGRGARRSDGQSRPEAVHSSLVWEGAGATSLHDRQTHGEA